MRENLSLGVCKQHSRRPACASAQSDQRLFYPLFESIIYNLDTGDFFFIFWLVFVAEETDLKLAHDEAQLMDDNHSNR